MRRALAVFLLLALAPAAGATTRDDARGDGGQLLDLKRVALVQRGSQVEWTVRTWGEWPTSTLQRKGASLCLEATVPGGGPARAHVCVGVGARGGPLLVAGRSGSRHVLRASVSRPDQSSLRARFDPLPAGLRHGDTAWAVRASDPSLLCAGQVCAGAAQRVDSAPDEGTAPLALRLLVLHGPRVRARGVAFRVTGHGADPRGRVAIVQRLQGRWSVRARTRADGGGRFRATFRPGGFVTRVLLRARLVGDRTSPQLAVRARDVTLAAVGDINLGDGVTPVMAARGPRWPWGDVAPVLRSADVAFGNLECSVSRRGTRVPKEFNFRGPPGFLPALHDYAGLDLVNMANNHAGDYGPVALLDTYRYVLRDGMLPIGGGPDAATAARPRVVTRLGLRIAFVGFSDIGPYTFAAGPHRPGTQIASVAAIERGVAAARRRADVVVATMHWGVERTFTPTARQHELADAAFRSGADAVIAAHPHVLQPVQRFGHRMVAWSLGNFVWAAGSGATSSTGILQLRLSARGVEHVHLRHAQIVDTRPRLR